MTLLKVRPFFLRPLEEFMGMFKPEPVLGTNYDSVKGTPVKPKSVFGYSNSTSSATISDIGARSPSGFGNPEFFLKLCWYKLKHSVSAESIFGLGLGVMQTEKPIEGLFLRKPSEYHLPKLSA